MSQRPEPDSGQRPHLGVGAATAGVSSGTLLALLANNLSDDYWFKTWLLIVAPSVTIAASAGWIFAKQRIGLRFEERKVQRAVSKARQTLRTALENPDIPEDHRAELQRELQELDMLEVRADLEVAKARMNSFVERRSRE